jgi:hypothetical protein
MDENEQDLVLVVAIHPAAAEVPATSTPDGTKKRKAISVAPTADVSP